jgi:hypothetical protein
MPRIELIPEVLYKPLDPIHWEIDNLPLKSILRRQSLINFSLDNVIDQIQDAIGTQGTISNRLNQSINPNGSLKAESIDNSMHSIEYHTDTDLYVKMTRQESEKLFNISNGATNTKFEIYTDEMSSFEFDNGTLRIKPSETIGLIFESPDTIRFNLNFPTESVHRHFYGIDPVNQDQINPDYTNYFVNSVATPFIDGSLRVYVNGVRIYSDAQVYVPGSLINDSWTLLSFDADPENGSFELSSALSSEDILKIDFDIQLT